MTITPDYIVQDLFGKRTSIKVDSETGDVTVLSDSLGSRGDYVHSTKWSDDYWLDFVVEKPEGGVKPNYEWEDGGHWVPIHVDYVTGDVLIKDVVGTNPDDYFSSSYRWGSTHWGNRTTRSLTQEKKAKDTQVGGSHYKDLAIQPIEFIRSNNIPYFEANVIKYVTRHKSKGGKQDIEKAIHYLELILDEYEEEKEKE